MTFSLAESRAQRKSNKKKSSFKDISLSAESEEGYSPIHLATFKKVDEIFVTTRESRRVLKA